MVTNALRAYLQLATGLTEVTKQKATDAAKQLSAQLGVQGDDAIATAGAVASIASQQIQTLTEDLLAAAKSNRKLLSDLVQFEVDRGASQLAKLDPQQLDGLLSAVRRLADEIASVAGIARSKASAPSAAAHANRTTATDARPLATKKTAKKATKKAARKTPAAKTTAAKAAAAKKAPTKKATAKKAPGKKAPAKKAAPHTVTEVTPAAPEPVLDLVPEQVIDLAPETTVDAVTAAAPEPALETVLETVPQSATEPAESSTESTL